MERGRRLTRFLHRPGVLSDQPGSARPCVAALLSLLWALYRYRLHQIAREFNARLEERVDERTRIARELHDTLLQSFQGLMLRFQVVDDLLPACPGEAKEALEEALDHGGSGDRRGPGCGTGFAFLDSDHQRPGAGRDGTWATNWPSQEFHRQFRWWWRVRRGTCIRSCGTKSTGSRGRQCAMLSATRRRAGSKRRSRMANGLLRLRVRDDGRGIDPGVAQDGRAGHYGLPGMRERAKRIGAAIECLERGWNRHGGRVGRSRRDCLRDICCSPALSVCAGRLHEPEP